MRILVVDDEQLLLRSLRIALRNEGHEVTAVTNGADALFEAAKAGFDLCFLDVQLPDADGIELIPRMHRLSPNMKIVIMTAIDLGPEQIAGLWRQSCSYLPKPFSLEMVRSVLRPA